MTTKQSQKIRWKALSIGAAGLWLAGCAVPTGHTPGVQPPDFAALYKAAQQRMKEPATPPSPAAGQAAFIDVAALAAHHPAWKLAGALDKSGSKSLSFSALTTPTSPQAVELRSEPLKFAASAPPQAVAESDDGSPAGEVPAYNRPPQRLSAREAVPLESAAKTRQEAAFAGFFNDVAERQQSTRDDLRMLWRSELEDEIEAAQRLSLTEMQPLQLPPDVQLEMTNLRLKLRDRTNLPWKLREISPEYEVERSAALTRLRALESEWREKLRLQENARLEELKKLQFELPDKMRQEGEVDISQRLQRLSTRDSTLRDEVAGTLRARIAAGFAPSETGAPDGGAPDGVLSIRLPGANLDAQRIEGGAATSESALAWARGDKITHQINNGIISTIVPFPSSTGASPDAGAPGKARSVPAVQAAPPTLNRAQTLRRQALLDAQRWAQAIARRRGWKLQARRAAGTPDRTREALRLLNMS